MAIRFYKPTSPGRRGMSTQDFGEIKHVDGVSPEWPLSYDDFEPYYTKAEWLFQVHGNHGEDPIEGHWSFTAFCLVRQQQNPRSHKLLRGRLAHADQLAQILPLRRGQCHPITRLHNTLLALCFGLP